MRYEKSSSLPDTDLYLFPFPLVCGLLVRLGCAAKGEFNNLTQHR